jgi:hypothetical protein
MGAAAVSAPVVGVVRFTTAERERLLALPRIGPLVIESLEAAGFHSLDAIRRTGLDAVVDAVCRQQGQVAWRNRRRALAAALA